MKMLFFGIQSKAARVAVAAITLSLLLVLSFYSFLFLFYKFAGLTSANAVLYYVQDHSGKAFISNEDLHFNESDKLIFMIDLSCLYNLAERAATAVIRKPLIETTWDDRFGHGIIKESRPDGSKFLVILSRYLAQDASPKGIFIGGDLPYGDLDRWSNEQKSGNNTGIAYYDGRQWHHLWCTINEGIRISGNDTLFGVADWSYLGSSVKKSSFSEVEIESDHELETRLEDGAPIRLSMRRALSKKSGDDYIIVRTTFHNTGSHPVTYTWSYGDEPWVGEFGGSSGDVGWTDDRLYTTCGLVSPRRHRFAGYWDIGNKAAGEARTFSGYANFIEWLSNPPDTVYFANSALGNNGGINERAPLDSPDGRVINLVWNRQTLVPGESKTYVVALGMAKPDPHTRIPVKPQIRLH